MTGYIIELEVEEVAKLVAEMDNYQGYVDLAEGWNDFTPLARMDMLGDWMLELEMLYTRAKEDFSAEMKEFENAGDPVMIDRHEITPLEKKNPGLEVVK